MSVTTSVRPGKRFVASMYASGVPSARMSTLATAFVRRVTSIALRTTGSASRSGTRPSGISANNATIGSARNVRTMPAHRASSAERPARPAPAAAACGDRHLRPGGLDAHGSPARPYPFGGSPKPAVFSSPRPRSERTLAMKPRAPDESAPLRLTAQIW